MNCEKLNEDEQWDAMRNAELKVTLYQQEVISLGYGIKDLFKNLEGGKLSFEQANCVASCFYSVKKLLNNVDPLYKAGRHSKMTEFFDGDVSSDWDRLKWHAPGTVITSKKCEEAEGW